MLRFHTEDGGQAEVGVNNPMPVQLAGGDPDNPSLVTVPVPATFYHGQKAVASAGNAEVLGTSQAITNGITVKALPDNKGAVYVGDNSVDSTNGYVLAAGEAVLIIVDDVAEIYVDAEENGDGVCWIGS
jgi:hypothetical protein